MAKVRHLAPDDVLQLLRLASGLLKRTNGDIVEAMQLAMPLHIELLQTIRNHEISADLGPGNAVLYVPPQGGLAIRLERHFADKEDTRYPAIDISGFEVTENRHAQNHYAVPSFDAGVMDDWDE